MYTLGIRRGNLDPFFTQKSHTDHFFLSLAIRIWPSTYLWPHLGEGLTNGWESLIIFQSQSKCNMAAFTGQSLFTASPRAQLSMIPFPTVTTDSRFLALQPMLLKEIHI